MKKWIGIMMMVALVVTTAMPVASHASMNHDHSKAANAGTATTHEDCHHAHKACHDKQAQSSKPCCEKGACKCAGGNCYGGGLAQILGHNDTTFFPLAASSSKFTFTAEHVDSALSERLKRPPKA